MSSLFTVPKSANCTVVKSRFLFFLNLETLQLAGNFVLDFKRKVTMSLCVLFKNSKIFDFQLILKVDKRQSVTFEKLEPGSECFKK